MRFVWFTVTNSQISITLWPGKGVTMELQNAPCQRSEHWTWVSTALRMTNDNRHGFTTCTGSNKWAYYLPTWIQLAATTHIGTSKLAQTLRKFTVLFLVIWALFSILRRRCNKLKLSKSTLAIIFKEITWQQKTTKNGQPWATNCLRVRWHYTNFHYYLPTWVRIYYLGVDQSHWMLINAAGSWTTCPVWHFKFPVLWDVMPRSLIEIYQTFERKKLPQPFRVLLSWK